MSSPFRWRNFVTCALALSSLVVAVSGVVLFLRPEGSLARWVGWSALGADKRQWEALHLASVSLFLAAALAHAWYNWNAIAAAVSARRPRAPRPRLRLRPEFIAALAVVGLVTAGSLADWQPLAALNALRSAIKDGRLAVSVPPPAADADRMSVRELCAKIPLDPAEAMANARARGLAIADPSKTLGEAAAELGVSPEALYQAMCRPVRP